MAYWLAWEEPRAVGDLVHVEKFFARNLGGLTRARTCAGPAREGNSRTPSMYADEKSDEAVVCAGQRSDQEGLSPSGAQMRSAVSKSGGNSSLAGKSGRYGEA